MPLPIWAHENLGAVEHRLVWWMIDRVNSDGMLERGWRQVAAVELGYSKEAIALALKELKNSGFVRYQRYGRVAHLKADAFVGGGN